LLAGKQQGLFPRNRAFPYSAVFSICASIWACRILPQINASRNPQAQTDPLPDFHVKKTPLVENFVAQAAQSEKAIKERSAQNSESK
jgi:hypothetical protein